MATVERGVVGSGEVVGQTNDIQGWVKAQYYIANSELSNTCDKDPEATYVEGVGSIHCGCLCWLFA